MGDALPRSARLARRHRMGLILTSESSSSMLDWIRGQSHLLGWLAGASILMLALSALALPWVIARMPTDHFVVTLEERRRSRRHPLIRALLSAVGVLFIVAGLLMLVLPGQGLLTILVGLMLFDGPGKQRIERWLARKRTVMRALNWIRRRSDRAPFEPPVTEP